MSAARYAQFARRLYAAVGGSGQPESSGLAFVVEVVPHADGRCFGEFTVRQPRPKAVALDEVQQMLLRRLGRVRLVEDLDRATAAVLGDFECYVDVTRRGRAVSPTSGFGWKAGSTTGVGGAKSCSMEASGAPACSSISCATS